MLETFVKWWIVFIMALHIFSTVSMVDKPRRTKPITASFAILTVIAWGLYIAGIIIFWD